MAARYWGLVADELFEAGDWPDGLRPAVPAQMLPVSSSPDQHFYLFDDDNASPSLEGQKVELSFGQGGADYGRRLVG